MLGTGMEVPVYSVLTPSNVADVIADGGDVAYVLVDGESVLEADALTATRTLVSLTADNVTAGSAGAEIQLTYSAVAASRTPKVYWFATEDVTDPSVLAVCEATTGAVKVGMTAGVAMYGLAAFKWGLLGLPCKSNSHMRLEALGVRPTHPPCTGTCS